MKKIIDKKDIEPFVKESQDLKIWNLLNIEEPSVSISRIDLSGENVRNKQKYANAFYYIMSGEGEFEIDGQTYPVHEGCLVCIPKGVIYKDKGNLKMISICVPRFDIEDVEFIDEL